MQIKFYTLAFALVLCQAKLFAQCTMQVPANASANAYSYAISTIQTFKPTCTGLLKSVFIPTIPVSADDLRGSGYFVTVRMKSATGTVLATGNPTDQWYPGATLTTDFTCSNVALTSGTVYQLEFLCTGSSAVGPPIQLFLFYKSTSSVYADGNVIEDGITKAASDLYGWQVNLVSGAIAASNTTSTQTITIPCTSFSNALPQLIATVVPGATNGISGSTTAKVWMETAQPAQFVKRHYEITPATNATTATGKVTLYFTQQDFNDFNAVNTVDLPANPTDATGKANLLIEKRPGTSSDGTGLPGTYTGTPATIDPADADIVWNATLGRWEVSFDVVGFSGFFVKTKTTVLPLHWLSFNASLDNGKHATLYWRVQEANVAKYEVQKSSDGQTFNTITSLTSTGNGENGYQFTEASVLDGLAYYRIKEVDMDGSNGYSATIKLSNGGHEATTVYPNPVKDMLVVTNATVGSKAMLLDASGKALLQITVAQTSFTVDMGKYSAGIYLLKTENGAAHKIIKQ